jgi:hypothetical protein
MSLGDFQLHGHFDIFSLGVNRSDPGTSSTTNPYVTRPRDDFMVHGVNNPLGAFFTVWLKVERPSISTNHIARNQEFNFSTLHTKAKVQRPWQFNMELFEEGDGLLKEVWVGREWKPKLWSRGRQFYFFIKESIIDKTLAIRLKELFWTRNKV